MKPAIGAAEPHGDGPSRAHSLVGKFESDTADGLAWLLRRFADDIEREQVTVGVSGSSSDGAIYSYRVMPGQTHNAYFSQITEWLEQAKEGRESK